MKPDKKAVNAKTALPEEKDPFFKKVRDLKPAAKMDENFGKSLRNELMGEFSRREQKRNEKSGFFYMLRGPIAGLAGAFAIVAITGVTLFINRDLFLKKSPVMMEEQKTANAMEPKVSRKSETVPSGQVNGGLTDKDETFRAEKAKAYSPEEKESGPELQLRQAPSPVTASESRNVEEAADDLAGPVMKKSDSYAAKDMAPSRMNVPLERSVSGTAGDFLTVKKALSGNKIPDSSAFTIDSLVNSFVYRYPAPPAGSKVVVTSESGVCLWDENRRLVFLAVRTETGVTVKAIRADQGPGAGPIAALGRNRIMAAEKTGGIVLVLETGVDGNGGTALNGIVTYRVPGDTVDRNAAFSVPQKINLPASGNFRFASAVACWGKILKGELPPDRATFEKIMELAENSAEISAKERSEFAAAVKKTRDLMSR